MMKLSPLFRRIALGAVGGALAVALFASSGFTPGAQAQGYGPKPPMFPCGGSPGPAFECHFYDKLQEINDEALGTFQFAVVTGLLNGMQFITQKFATDAAQWMLNGFNGKGTAFYNTTFGDYLGNLTLQAANQVLSDIGDWTSAEWGFNLCQPITLDLKLGLALQSGLPPRPEADCTFSQIAEHYEQAYRGLAPDQIGNTLRKTVGPGGNDMSIGLKANEKFLGRIIATEQAGILNREEGGGFKLLTDALSGRIQTPVQVAQDTVRVTNAVDLAYKRQEQNATVMALGAFWAGFQTLPAMFASTFLNTLAVGLLQKFFESLNATDVAVSTADVTNPDSQASANPTIVPVSVTDILAPNLVSADVQNFVFELSTCPNPRGLWGCSMDNGFVSALQDQTETGGYTVLRAAGLQPGVSGGTVFLHPDWELIPESEAKDNQDSGCYQRAYCATNLAKMRFARIIPVGWELAANSPFNKKTNGRYVSLGTVVRNFNVCNSEGKLDVDHPWCHLIDPTWVLAAPEFQCRIKGFGETVTPGGTPVRVQECSDVVSCLSHDDKGNCTGGYGYCLAEKTVWRFGADSCNEKYVSCRTYQARDKAVVLNGTNLESTATGPFVSYIRNTIDYGSCNADNVGCMYYAARRDVSTTTTGRWIGNIGSNQAISGQRSYFDATVQTCDAANEGCTKVLSVQPGQPALNLVQNGGFESTVENQPNTLVGWKLQGSYQFKPFVPVGPDAGTSPQSAEFDGVWSDGITQTVDVVPLRNYVLSFSARANETNLSHTAEFSLNLLKANGQPVAPNTSFYRSTNCVAGPTGIQGSPGAGTAATQLTAEWQRFTCEFVTNDDAAKGEIAIDITNAVVDDIQLEEGNFATAFVDGDNLTLPVDYLKLSPQELSCSGDKTTDRTECKDFARLCKQTDAGCQAYRDVGGADLTEIPATLNARDYCPNSCVGYAEYQKLPTAFDLTQNPSVPYLHDADDVTNAFFVPKAAVQCSAAGAGCEEFTNIEAPSAGGEQKIHLNYARACLKPNADTRTYFTWEGSDTTGYQLRTWSLIQKTAADSNDPQYALPTTAPRILRKASPGGLVKDPAGCTEDDWKTGTDPDCRQFYDESGAVYYRYFSQTIVSDPACLDYRKNDSTTDDCAKTGGDYNPANKECIYHILQSQSNSCSAAEAGCRGYLGTTGRNAGSVFKENFANATTTSFTAGPASTAKLSTEALLVGDYSLQIGAAGLGAATAVFPTTANTLYTVSFWMKTTDPAHKTAKIFVNGTQVGDVVTEVDWKRYEIGPFRVTSSATSSIMSWSSLPNVSYLDQVNIERLQDIVYVKKDSWVVPSVCDETPEGIPQLQAMLGCREYQDRKNRIVDVREFSHLCRFENVGCSAFVDTRDSFSAYAESFAMTGLPAPDPTDLNAKQWDRFYSGTVTTTRPADRFVYLIDEPSAHCDAANASCRAFGKPAFNAQQRLDLTATPFETVYLKDDITQYVDDGGEPKMLCRPSELFCDRYVAKPPGGSTITSYYRDPLKHVCEWKDNILLTATSTPSYNYPSGSYSGWFIKDINPPTPCYPGKISSGNTFLFEFAGAPGYRGWTALCPADQSECTEFRDPNDHSDAIHPLGKPYFFISNSRLDKSSCAGKVDLLGGCVLFRDTSDSILSFSTKASYDKAHAENDNPTTPVDCVNDSNNPYCMKAGKCVNVHLSSDPVLASKVDSSLWQIFAEETSGAACSTNTDCSLLNLPHEDASALYIIGECKGSSNDANLILKVKLARDCTTWLGCASGETVYDPQQQKYIDLCEDLAMCDQSLGSTGKNFCAHYVDRSAAAPKPKLGEGTYEPVMRQGAFFDLVNYTSRPTGFGIPDYSSYALPNHFQIADYETRKVAYELLVNRPGAKRDSFVRDYRLVAAARLYEGTAQSIGPDTGLPAAYASDPYAAARYHDTKYTDLNLCMHKQTGRIGYYVLPLQPENNRFCYFAIDTPVSANVTEVLFGLSPTNPRNAQKLADQFVQLETPEAKQSLSMAYPQAECRAYPDGQSPFPNSYVKEWDFAKDPPAPLTYVTGYDGAPYCEFGEDCSCNYRKVSYGGIAKYLSTYGESPPQSGVCVGGDRDGQACVPGATQPTGSVSIPSADGTGPPTTIPGSGGSPSDVCGGTGTCQGVDTVTLVSGLYAQCLQRDFSRIIGGTQEHNPCLIWDPSPVLFGQKDIYHYQPTAGYLPPQNSGEYYCVSGALPPVTLEVSAYTGGNPDPAVSGDSAPFDFKWITPPGLNDAFSFDEDYISDGDCAGCSGNDGGDDAEDVRFLDGNPAAGGSMGQQCEQADDNVNGGDSFVGSINTGHVLDQMAGRWIQTRRGRNENYVEYFVGFNGAEWAKKIRPGNQEPDELQIQERLMEHNFAYFSFSPIVNPNGLGLMGCGMTTDWVDGVTIDDYQDTDQLKTGQEQWNTYFSQNFNGMLTRESSAYLKRSDGTTLLKNDCVNPLNASEDGDEGCFYKYWEIGYRNEGQKQFIGVEDHDGQPFDPAHFQVKALSSANKAFFAIRAMFEDTNKTDNASTAAQMSENQLTGPFQFVGWWITATVPGAADERAIYMYLTIGSASICQEVAQVISPDTRENAAFVDRVSSGGGFNLPLLGFTYSTVNPPFGAAMNTRPIGIEPLFQTHGRIPGITSGLKPPTFISSGQEYFQYTTASVYPKGAWGMLTNLFARVYRVYRYYDNAAGPDSNVCIDGLNQLQVCDPTKNLNACSLTGKCDTGAVDPAKFGGLCNALSGVNSGLPCSANDGDPLTGYAVCHNAAVQFDKSGVPDRLTTNCELDQANWTKVPDKQHYFNVKTGAPTTGEEEFTTLEDAVARGAYRCGQSAVTINGLRAKCDPSVKDFCPIMVIGDGQYNNGQPDSKGRLHSGCNSEGRCMGFEHAQCKTDKHCQFTELEWWGEPDAQRPWGGKLVPDTAGTYKLHPIFDDPETDSKFMNGECTGPNPKGCTMDSQCGAAETCHLDDNTSGEANLYGQYARHDEWFQYSDSREVYDFTLDPTAFFPYTYYGQDVYAQRKTFSGVGQINKSLDPEDMPSAGNSWWQGFDTNARFATEPVPYETGDGDKAPGQDIAGHDLYGGGFIRLDYTGPIRDSVSDVRGAKSFDEVPGLGDAPSLIDRFPGAYAATIITEENETEREAKYGLFIPGHCERLPTYQTAGQVTDKIDPLSTNASGVTPAQSTDSVRRAVKYDRPYAPISWMCDANNDTINNDAVECDFDDHGGDTDQWFEFQRYFSGGDPDNFGLPGLCASGPNQGTTCNTENDDPVTGGNTDCQQAGVTPAQITASAQWCKPADPPKNSPYYEVCHPPGFQGDPNSTDLDKDDNLCTHNAGYYPRADLCGSDSSKAQCLTAYKVKGVAADTKKSVDPDSDNNPLPPTDVTMGLHLPSFLGADNPASDFSYIARYSPSPPTIAAPDTTHACASAGSCPISLVNAFSLEGYPEGTVAYVGGQAVANIRFYAWSGQEQGPLKDMWVDWGDYKVQEIHDASMKNHKPFCGVQKECQFVPGLTCNADTDCPPAAGACATRGYCSSRAWVSCLKNADCINGGIQTDTCLPRTPFGSTTEACEQNFFEFTHAYACGKEAAALPDCETGNTGLCSRENNRTCTIGTNAGCAPGDKCLAGLAKPGGCFDAVKNSCRFTPRVLLKDNWGWCTGECRTSYTGQSLTYGPIGTEAVPHVNGGCYDFSKDVANYDVDANNSLDDEILDTPALANECSPDNAGDARPWIVYNGALQLGITQ